MADSPVMAPLPRLALRAITGAHRALYRATGGRLGRRLARNDMLLLTTRGRRTGRPHTVPLLYLREGQELVVIASYGGHPRHPDWYENLLADPRAAVQAGPRRFEVTARTTEGEERRRLWARAVAAWDGYAGYQGKTDRVIPVVLLRRA